MQKINDFYFEKPFIKTLESTQGEFFFFDYDERAAAINMEFQHLHPFYEIMLYLGQQKATHYINGIPYEIKCGDMILLKPGLLHMSEYPQGNPSDRVIIQFTLPSHSDDFSQFHTYLLQTFEESCPIYRFTDPSHTQFVKLFNQIYVFLHSQELNLPSTGYCMLYHYFIDFLHVLTTCHDHNIYSPAKVSDALTQKIYDINTYILTHYQENLTLENLAKHFYISPCYLSHQFKKVNQFTISSYIQMTRIRNAQFLLMSSDYAISEIAQQCGFQSFSQFNRMFQRYTGCSPSAYKKSLPNGKLPQTFTEVTSS